MGTEHSKRAEILKRVLSYINNSNYAEEDGYIVFGTSSVWDLIMDLTDPPQRTGGPLLGRLGGKAGQ